MCGNSHVHLSPIRACASSVVGIVIAISGALAAAPPETIPARYQFGDERGDLALRSMDGRLLATGEQTRTVDGDRVRKRLTFHFTDGSLDDEQTTFSQQGMLRLVAYRHTQKGSSYPHPIDMSIDVANERVTVRYVDEDGEAKADDETMKLPPDLSNGMVIDLLENVRPSSLPLSVSYVVTAPKPRIIELKIRRAGADVLSVAGATRQAIHYAIAIHVGGVEGLIGSWIGKLPDSHVWIADGVPAFIKSETILSASTPMWRIEPAN